ncbi:MAG: GntR family transcriptional regulator [Marinicellaceae bacterium]
MQIEIDIESATPIFTQLITQIKNAVVNGNISPGSPLPSIRQLANDLEVNNKTVAKAYRLLERDSVIQSKGYRGSFIHPEALTNSTVDLNQWVEKTLTKVINDFKKAGVTDSEIRIAFNQILKNK